MQWSVFVLILMGQCSCFTCQLYEYHFVEKEMTWTEAQKHCKEKYTDLATVYDMQDVKVMKKLRKTKANEDEAWIGLHDITAAGTDMVWHWSLPGVEYYEHEDRWGKSENPDPNGVELPEACVAMNKNRKWLDNGCHNKFKFICYNDTKPNGPHALINKTKNWLQAQAYCRRNHTDLISGAKQLEEAKTLTSQGDKIWIGLFRDIGSWSSGSTSSFRNWNLKFFKEKMNNTGCATVRKKSGKWDFADCNDKKPFFCYENKVILIKENKTWEEALYYCRDNYDDLVSITTLGEQQYVQEIAKEASSPFVWLGLRYTCTLNFWFWVNDEKFRYQNWNETVRRNGCDLSGAMKKGGKHKWFKKPDEKKFNFICSTC